MKKKCMKRTVAMALALMLMMSTMVMSAGASSVVGLKRSITGQIGSVSLTGTVEIGNKNATATLLATEYCDSLSVEVTLYYGYGDVATSVGASSSHNGPAASAIATTSAYAIEELGAEGKFSAVNGAYVWAPPAIMIGRKQ